MFAIGIKWSKIWICHLQNKWSTKASSICRLDRKPISEAEKEIEYKENTFSCAAVT